MNTPPQTADEIKRQYITRVLLNTVEARVAKISDPQSKLSTYQTNNKWITYLLRTDLSPTKEVERTKIATIALANYKKIMREKRKKYLIHLLKRASVHARLHILDEDLRRTTVDTYERVLADLTRTHLNPAQEELQAKQVNDTLLCMVKPCELEKVLGSSK